MPVKKANKQTRREKPKKKTLKPRKTRKTRKPLTKKPKTKKGERLVGGAVKDKEKPKEKPPKIPPAFSGAAPEDLPGEPLSGTINYIKFEKIIRTPRPWKFDEFGICELTEKQFEIKSPEGDAQGSAAQGDPRSPPKALID